MSDDDELGGELDRVLRVALTVSGQMAERLARSRADAERAAHNASLEARREAERRLARRVEGGRAVYGAVREPQLWEQANAQQRLGEALVAAEALRDADPVARPAAQYIRAEARRRYGPDSDAWLAAGIQAYLDDVKERSERVDPHLPYLEACRWLAEHDPAAYEEHRQFYDSIEDREEHDIEKAHLVRRVNEMKKNLAETPAESQPLGEPSDRGTGTETSSPAPSASDRGDAAGEVSGPRQRESEMPVPKTEQQIASEAFPIAAAEDLHRRPTSRRSPTPRRTPARTRDRSRSR